VILWEEGIEGGERRAFCFRLRRVSQHRGFSLGKTKRVRACWLTEIHKRGNMMNVMRGFDSPLGIVVAFVLLTWPFLALLLVLWICYLVYFNPLYGCLLAFISIICFGPAAYRNFMRGYDDYRFDIEDRRRRGVPGPDPWGKYLQADIYRITGLFIDLLQWRGYTCVYVCMCMCMCVCMYVCFQ